MTQVHTKPEWAKGRRDRDNEARIAEGKKPRRRIWPWVILALIIVAVAAFFFTRPATAPVEQAEAETPVVKQIRQSETTVIEPMTLRETVKVTGTLVAGKQAAVASQASGRVMAVMVEPGDQVREGDVLAQIDRATLELQLSQQRATADATRAQLESSRQQLERTEQLATQGLATPSALDQARSATAALQANLDALEIGVRSAELALSNATVKAPLSGIVASRSVDPGQSVAAGTALFNIVNLDQMVFEAAASVSSSARVTAGQPATILVTGLDNQEFSGVVRRVNPVAVSGTRTVPIYIDLENVGNSLRGGMFATGFITIVEKEGAHGLPESALREDADGNFVLVLGDGVLVRKAVEVVGEWDRGRLIEVSGLQEGDVVVSAALPDLAADEAFVLVEG